MPVLLAHPVWFEKQLKIDPNKILLDWNSLSYFFNIIYLTTYPVKKAGNSNVHSRFQGPVSRPHRWPVFRTDKEVRDWYPADLRTELREDGKDDNWLDDRSLERRTKLRVQVNRATFRFPTSRILLFWKTIWHFLAFNNK